VEIVKYALDGSSAIWTAKFLYCQTTSKNDRILFAAGQSKVFVVCSAVNLITIYNSKDGKIIGEYAIDEGIPVAIECSANFLFILYEDGKVVQYTLDFNYIYTYRADKMTTAKYSTLRVDGQYMFNLLCNKDVGYNGCFIIQWSVQTNRTSVIFTYVKSKRLENVSDLRIKNENTMKRKFIMFENFNLENSFFTPATYKDDINQQHLVFFSGGGIIGKASCGDIFFHDLIIRADKVQPSIEIFSLLTFQDINYPRSDYAATLLKKNGKHFYLVHGGISCDSHTIYSDIFAIDILARQYIKVEHESEISQYNFFLNLAMVMLLPHIMEHFTPSSTEIYICLKF
jgi:hypothetical protein